MVSRRRALQTAGGALVGALAGCVTFSGRDSRPEIGNVRVANHVPEPTSVSVLLTASGSPVYWRSKRAPAASDDTDDPGWVAFSDLPDEPGDYTLRVRTAAQRPDEWTTADLDSRTTDCVSYMVLIGSRGTDGTLSGVSMFVAGNDGFCEESAEN